LPARSEQLAGLVEEFAGYERFERRDCGGQLRDLAEHVR